MGAIQRNRTTPTSTRAHIGEAEAMVVGEDTATGADAVAVTEAVEVAVVTDQRRVAMLRKKGDTQLQNKRLYRQDLR